VPGSGRSDVRWRTRIAFGYSTAGPGLLQVKKLTGILVRCPKCGNQTGVLYQNYESPVHTDGYYLKCRSCREKMFISQRAFEALVSEVLPATYTRLLR
jgi:DNA-directed RNA polymerase subunit N (RpoN/RPB10)